MGVEGVAMREPVGDWGSVEQGGGTQDGVGRGQMGAEERNGQRQVRMDDDVGMTALLGSC